MSIDHATEDQGHGHDHGEDALGPIDVAAWGAGLLGVAIALGMAVAFAMASGAVG